MAEQKQSNNNSIDLIIHHFILAISIFIQALIKILNIVIPHPKDVKYSMKIEKSQRGLKRINPKNSLLLEKSSDQLKKILRGVDLISTLKKSQLTELILSSEEAMELIEVEQRRNSLEKLTNQNIKALLRGVQGISRYRKSELIEMVLKQERIKKSQQSKE